MFSGNRLALARKRRRFTARILAEQSGVSPVTISRLEKSRQEPDEQTIALLAEALKYPREFFFLPDVDGIGAKSASFRSLTSLTAREREAALAAGCLAFEFADWVKARFNLPEPDIIDLEYENHPAAAARTLRQYWSIGEKPIGHLIRLLEAKGVRVFSLAENTKRVDAFSCWRGDEPYIFLNTFKTAERSRFDAAHELGHLVLHKHGGPTGREAEYQANSFASAFLMPEADVVSVVPYVTSLRELVAAKKRWGVSVAALAFRLHKMRPQLITDWQYKKFCIEIERNYGDSEPNGLVRERSSVLHMALTELWREGVTRQKIAADLHFPSDELEALLFGLADHQPPTKSSDRPALRFV